jgi:transcriptional regulator with XRE-family HTH domain
MKQTTVGKNIRYLREKVRNLSQRDLGDALSVDKSLVAHWERGSRNPLTYLYAIAAALEVPATMLLQDPEDVEAMYPEQTEEIPPKEII